MIGDYQSREAAGRAVIRELDGIRRATFGHRNEVFRDWLDVVEHTLRMLPTHAEHVLETGAMAEDDEQAAAVWERLRSRYKDSEFVAFRNSFQVLMRAVSAEDGEPIHMDLPGWLYMNWAVTNDSAGQFFTPWEVTVMMAQITADGAWIERTVIDRIAEACEKAGIPELAVLAIDERLAVRTVLPACWEHYEPVTVCDPCCGSGTMLLAVAAQLPRWMVVFGLVQFYGQDVDGLCCQMARVNFMLYGLYPYGLRLQAAGSQLAARFLELQPTADFAIDVQPERRSTPDDEPRALQPVTTVLPAEPDFTVSGDQLTLFT